MTIRINLTRYIKVNQTVNEIAIALLFYCLKHRPLSYCNLYPRYDEKAEKKKTKHGLNAQ